MESCAVPSHEEKQSRLKKEIDAAKIHLYGLLREVSNLDIDNATLFEMLKGTGAIISHNQNVKLTTSSPWR